MQKFKTPTTSHTDIGLTQGGSKTRFLRQRRSSKPRILPNYRFFLSRFYDNQNTLAPLLLNILCKFSVNSYYLAILSITLFTFAAAAQPKPKPPIPTSPPVQVQTLSPQERRELQKLRQEKEDLEQEKKIGNLVQSEVDRAFSRTTTLINILLFVMILFPVVTALGFWLLRRSVINQLVAEIKKELHREVEKQLETQVAADLNQQTAAFKQEMDKLQGEYLTHLSQLQVLFRETQQEKEQIIQAISNLIPAAMQALISPEVQDKMEELTDQLSPLTEENSHLIFTADAKNFIPGENQTLMAQDQYEMQSIVDQEEFNAELDARPDQVFNVNDYIYLGNTYLSAGRYQEANQSYNEALKLERDLPEVRYQNARAYALRGSINPAIGNLQWAIDIDPQYKEMAKTDSVFDYLRGDEQFIKLVYE